MTSPLTQLVEETLSAAEGCRGRSFVGPARYVAVALANAEKLARITKVMSDGLTWIMPKVHQGHHEGPFDECGKATCIVYRAARDDANQIASEP